jgi:hypothetical protein
LASPRQTDQISGAVPALQAVRIAKVA